MEIVVKGKKVTDESVLSYKSNPKRPGFAAHERYEIYQEATTLAELIEISEENEVRGEPVRKKMRADLMYDFEHGHLVIDNQTYDKENKRVVDVDAE